MEERLKVVWEVPVLVIEGVVVVWVGVVICTELVPSRSAWVRVPESRTFWMRGGNTIPNDCALVKRGLLSKMSAMTAAKGSAGGGVTGVVVSGVVGVPLMVKVMG